MAKLSGVGFPRDCGKSRGFRREKELLVLQNSVDRIALETGAVSPLLCLIQGHPGSGRGDLCDELELYCEGKGVLFCRGFFEEGKTDTAPFPAVAGSLRTLYKKLTRSGKDECEWKKRFEVGLGMHKATLATILPELLEQDSEHSSDVLVRHLDRIVDPSNFNLLVTALRVFLRLVCNYQPVVWVLEELQMACGGSFKIVRTLLNDNRLENLCCVGTHTFDLIPREDSMQNITLSGTCDCEIDDSGTPTYATMLEFRNSRLPELLVEIRLKSLSEVNIADMLSDLTESNQDTLKPLAGELHRATGGNRFLVQRSISLLRDQELLYKNGANSTWEYNIDEVKGALTSCIDVVASKISLMPKRERQPLIHASCLGSHFCVDDLFYALDHKSDMGKTAFQSVEDLKHVLQGSVENGILKYQEDDKGYVFAHRRILESTYSLVPEDDRAFLHLQIGRNMLRMVQGMSEAEQFSRKGKRMRLKAIRQINKGAKVLHPEERVWLAKLNHQAARLSLADAQFFPAVSYLSMGLQFVDTNDKHLWETDYCTLMGLVTLMARTKFVIGRLDDSTTLFDCILANARTFHDKLPAYYMKALGLSKKGKMDEAFDLVLNVISKLEVDFSPKDYRKFQGSSAMAKTGCDLARYSDEKLMNIVGSNTGPLFDAIDFVIYLQELASLKGESGYYNMAQVWMAKTTLKGGPSALTRLSYVSWAMYFIDSGDFKKGGRFGDLVAKMEAMLDDVDVHDVRATLLYACYCQHWKHPYQLCMDLLLKTNRLVLERGYSELIGFGILGYSSFYFCSGMNLDGLEQDLTLGFETLNELGYVSSRDSLAPILQLVRILQKGFEVGGHLSGDVMDQDTFLTAHHGNNDKNQKFLHSFYLAQVVLLYAYGEFVEAFQVLKQLENLKRPFNLSVWVPYESFCRGMVLYALARKSCSKTEKVKYVREGDKTVKQLSEWVKNGAVNCYHKWMLLKAERHSVSKRSSPDSVRKDYDAAIAAAARLGFLQDRALGNERAGLYFLDQGDKELATSFLSEARLSYCEWGALGKAEQIATDFGSMISMPVRHAGTKHRARARMSVVIQEVAQNLSWSFSSSFASVNASFSRAFSSRYPSSNSQRISLSPANP